MKVRGITAAHLLRDWAGTQSGHVRNFFAGCSQMQTRQSLSACWQAKLRQHLLRSLREAPKQVRTICEQSWT